jgi:hypothetical protein
LALNVVSLMMIRKFKEKYKVNTLWLEKIKINKTIHFMILH